MRQFQIKITEDELKALIEHHAFKLHQDEHNNTETTERLHNLMKRLCKDTPEITAESDHENIEQADKTVTAEPLPAWPTNSNS